MTAEPVGTGSADSRELAFINARHILDQMAEADIRVICTLPETWLAALLAALDEDQRFTTIPVAREEEGIGILTGCFFGATPGALIMSNSGFLTCGCALNGLASRSGIPMLLMVAQRGELDETQVLQGNVAAPTIGVLEALRVRYFRVDKIDDVEIIGKALRLAYVLREPVAVLLGRDALLGRGSSVYWFRDPLALGNGAEEEGR